jgi:hypothetical protein
MMCPHKYPEPVIEPWAFAWTIIGVGSLALGTWFGCGAYILHKIGIL